MTLVFDVSRSVVDVADVFDKSEAVSGVQLVEVSQVWLAGVPLPEAAVYLLPRDERSVHDADLAVRVQTRNKKNGKFQTQPPTFKVKKKLIYSTT